MVKQGELPEPSSATHLAKLTPLKRLGGKMSKEACQESGEGQVHRRVLWRQACVGRARRRHLHRRHGQGQTVGRLLLRRLQGAAALAAAAPASCTGDFICGAEGGDRGEAPGGSRPPQACSRGDSFQFELAALRRCVLHAMSPHLNYLRGPVCAFAMCDCLVDRVRLSTWSTCALK